MSRLPDALDLLATAYDALTKKVVPALPEKSRYDALMIGNALRIAMRELGAVTPDHVAWEKERDLAQAIRRGEYDNDAEIAHALRRSTVAKLQISNPKALLSSSCPK